MVDLENMKKDAKVSMEKQAKPDGYVYSTVKGKQEFHPIEKVLIGKYKMTVEDLVNYCKNLELRLEKLKEVNAEMLDKIIELEGKVKVWIG